MTKTRSHSSFVVAVAAIALFGGAAGLTLAVAPMPTDAAVGPAQAAGTGCPARLAEVRRDFGISLTNLSTVAEA